MIEIREAGIDDIPTIHELAHQIWWPTYQGIISDTQITFMLENIYSELSLKKQLEEGNTFLLLCSNQEAKGFAAFSKTDIDKTYKLQKIYLHPDQQGRGTGRKLIEAVEDAVKKLGADHLILNVQRDNKARFFYEKNGYSVIQVLDIPYYDFVLNDYIMQKELI
ncbi:MAG: GNAT family N-acetyltransferase [Bacteroidetes bacterium]|nr:GNAT family N-acetyltransferase [Bacteroidota bacterium]MBU1373752.1 GNAT family N-acetyltransferase [Bacteroidota bacterium]MBU1486146.1 GNAT family N-acetyltransferase [Bacteroidota bacterium]MBU1761213.1 GNAT family N-acetyltransferase [Bacteroidota bacterium]MBU2045331.1 GNAT family N-acetyltransferase [Bacteroidota bacterium]